MDFIEGLLSLDDNIDATKIAEMLWLASIITSNSKTIYSTKTDKSNSIRKKKTQNPNINDRELNNNFFQENIHEVVIKKANHQKRISNETFEGTSQIPTFVATLDNKDIFSTIYKYLEEFKIKQNVQDSKHIDEERTAEYIANTEIVNPLFKSIKKKTSFFTLNLVIDQHDSMFIWEDTVNKFKRDIKQSKVFKQVNFISLDSSSNYAKLYNSSSSQKLSSLSAIFNDRTSITLIISDIIGNAWKSNSVFNDLIEKWINKTFVSIVSLLPVSFWERTPLRQGSKNLVFSNKKLPRNRDLKVQYDFIEKDLSENLNRIPIISLEGKSLQYLSYLINARKNKLLNAYIFDKLERREISDKVLVKNPTQYEIKEMVERFFASVSPEARNLAIYCSVLPLHLKIIKEVIKVKKLGNLLETFAEFTFGGLLDRSIRGDKYNYYSFYPNVRRELMQYINMTEIKSIYRILDSTIKQTLGVSKGFIELLYELDESDEYITETERELIEILVDVLKEKGTALDNTNLKYLTQKINTVYPEKNWFMMGSNENEEEKPIHRVVFDYDFEVGKYPITVGEFREFIQDTQYKTEAELNGGSYVKVNNTLAIDIMRGNIQINKKDDAFWDNPYYGHTDMCPVTCISWNDAKEYIVWLNKKTGLNYRLLSESEWEYISKAGQNTKYFFGDDIDNIKSYAWVGDSNSLRAFDVGKKLSNQWNVYDIYGNVLEWCEDDFSDSYENVYNDGKAYIDKNKKEKVLRGGAWYFKAEAANSTIRFRNSPDFSSSYIGFRIARTISNQDIKKSSRNVDNLPEMIRIVHPRSEKSFTFPMIKISKGKFTFGEAQDIRTYKIDYDLEIGKYPVTVKEFKYFIEDTGYITEAEKDKGAYIWQKNGIVELKKDANWKNPYFLQTDEHPVVCLTIKDINEYISWLNKKTNKKYRLPTEEEWEYIAFSMTYTPLGIDKKDDLQDYAWYYNNSNGKTHPVGKKLPNKWGIYDMIGNVWEFCYPEAIKGGSWGTVRRRIYIRNRAERGSIHCDNKMGFRLVYSKNVSLDNNSNKVNDKHQENSRVTKDPDWSKLINELEKAIKNVYQKLEKLGWNKNNFKKNSKNFDYNANIITLTINNNITTAIQVKNNIESSNIDEKSIKQLHEFAKNANIDFAYITDGKRIYEYNVKSTLYKQVKQFPSKTQILINLVENKKIKNIVLYECNECNELDYLSCNKLNWYTVGIERIMGLENEYQAVYNNICRKCNNEIKITLTCLGYQTVAEKTRRIEAIGAKDIKGDCCLDFQNVYSDEKHIEEDMEKNEMDNVILEAKEVLEIEDWLIKRYKNLAQFPITLGNIITYTLDEILFEHFENISKEIIDDAKEYIKEKYGDIEWQMIEQNLYEQMEERIESLKILVDKLIPYSQLDYTSDYAREDYSDEDEYPEPVYLIDANFDENYLEKIIDEIEEDINELSYFIKEKDFENKNEIETLLEKKYKISYENIYESLGIDFECEVHDYYSVEYEDCIIFIEPIEKNSENEWESFNTEADMIEEWFYQNYEDPANSLPYASEEGSYIPANGSLVTTEEAILKNFKGEVSDGAIREAISRIENEHGLMEWSPIPQGDDEMNDTSDDWASSLKLRSGKLDSEEFLNSLNNLVSSSSKEKRKIAKSLKSLGNSDTDKLTLFFNEKQVLINSINSKYEKIHAQIDGDFNGWEGETIVKLTNGDIWQQSEYYYHYIYTYMPNVIISNSPTGYKMKVDGIDKEVGVIKLNNDSFLNGSNSEIIVSRIDGDFNGWDGETIFKLTNGQVWQQSKYAYYYKYKFMPKVIIYREGAGYKMKLDGYDKTVDVKRIS